MFLNLTENGYADINSPQILIFCGDCLWKIYLFACITNGELLLFIKRASVNGICSETPIILDVKPAVDTDPLSPIRIGRKTNKRREN